MNFLIIDLGDEASSYPPLVAPENVEPLRAWIAKNITAACAFGDHLSMCGGVCSVGSRIVAERPCLCSCHRSMESIT